MYIFYKTYLFGIIIGYPSNKFIITTLNSRLAKLRHFQFYTLLSVLLVIPLRGVNHINNNDSVNNAAKFLNWTKVDVVSSRIKSYKAQQQYHHMHQVSNVQLFSIHLSLITRIDIYNTTSLITFPVSTRIK